MRPNAIQPSPRTHTFTAAADLADADALKTSIATSVTAQTYAGATLNGVAANPGPAVLDPPRFFSVATSTQAATYNTTDPIVVTGTYGGQTVTENVTLANAGGNESKVGNQPFDTIVSVATPAQLTTNGAFTFGLSGVACKKPNGNLHPYRQVRAIGAGNLKVGYSGGFTDTFAMTDGEKDTIEPVRIYAVGTTVGVKLYE